MNDGQEPLHSHGNCRPDGVIQGYLYGGENPGENIGMDLFLPGHRDEGEGEGDHHAGHKHGVEHGQHDQDLPESHLVEKMVKL